MLTRFVARQIDEHVDSALPDDIAFWSRGQIMVGTLRSVAEGENVSIDSTSLALGIDRRVSEQLTLGTYVQWTTDNDKLGTASAAVDLDSSLLTIYASYLPDNVHYIQGSLGRGDVDVNIMRNVNGTNYSGNRDGEHMLVQLSAGRKLARDDYDLTISFDSSLQRVKLAAYRENSGAAAYHFMEQELESLFVGGHVRFSDETETPSGLWGYFVQLGYQSDVSDGGTAQAYFLSDTSTLYSYDYDTDAKNSDYSMSHASLALGASLARMDDWHLSGGLEINRYNSGSTTNLTLQASKTF